jgi:hypothetical protein
MTKLGNPGYVILHTYNLARPMHHTLGMTGRQTMTKNNPYEIEIENKFHNTFATIRPRWIAPGIGTVSARAMKRADDICCGMECSCGGAWSEDWELLDQYDGSWKVIRRDEW